MQSSSAQYKGRNLSKYMSKGRIYDPCEDLDSVATPITVVSSPSSTSATADSRLGEEGSSDDSRPTLLASGSPTIAMNDASFDSNREALCKHYHHPGIPSTPDASASKSSTTEHQQPQDMQQTTGSGVHPEKEAMKRHRRDNSATFAAVGAGVGTLILPVVGTIVLGVVTGYARNQTLKRHERKVQRKWERDQFQRDASASQTARHAIFV